MTREEAIEQLNFMIETIPKEPSAECDSIKEWLDTDKDIRNALEMAIKALEQESCKDAVSRQAVLNTLNRMDSVLDENRTVETYKELLIACYNDLPPVTPERPKGHWINIDKTHSKCDKCESIFEIVSANGEANYCPNCGAKIESEEK